MLDSKKKRLLLYIYGSFHITNEYIIKNLVKMTKKDNKMQQKQKTEQSKKKNGSFASLMAQRDKEV